MVTCGLLALSKASFITDNTFYCSVHICSSHASRQQDFDIFTQVIRDPGHLSFADSDSVEMSLLCPRLLEL